MLLKIISLGIISGVGCKRSCNLRVPKNGFVHFRYGAIEQAKGIRKSLDAPLRTMSIAAEENDAQRKGGRDTNRSFAGNFLSFSPLKIFWSQQFGHTSDAFWVFLLILNWILNIIRTHVAMFVLLRPFAALGIAIIIHEHKFTTLWTYHHDLTWLESNH